MRDPIDMSLNKEHGGPICSTSGICWKCQEKNKWIQLSGLDWRHWPAR